MFVHWKPPVPVSPEPGIRPYGPGPGRVPLPRPSEQGQGHLVLPLVHGLGSPVQRAGYLDVVRALLTIRALGPRELVALGQANR